MQNITDLCLFSHEFCNLLLKLFGMQYIIMLYKKPQITHVNVKVH